MNIQKQGSITAAVATAPGSVMSSYLALTTSVYSTRASMKASESYRRVITLSERLAYSLQRGKLLVLLVLVDTFLYSAVSILRHWHFGSAWDLAVFDQAIWLYSKGLAPNVTVRFNMPVNLLGDHFHPITAVLAPLFWIVDRAETLLVAQGFLLALSVVPVFLFAERRLGRAAAWLFTLAYSLYWGLQRTAEFDFHEIAFAVPVIALAIYFIDLRARKGYLACLVLLLFIKEDLAALIAFFGLYLIILGLYKDGLISLLTGAACFLLLPKVVIPFFGIGPYDHWTYEQVGPDLWGALKTLATRPLLVLRLLISPAIKLQTTWLLFSPFLFLSLLSPILVLVVPIVAERFLSSRPVFWAPLYHSNAVITPILALAAADGLARIARLIKPERARRTCVLLLALGILLVNLYMLPGLPVWALTSGDHWRVSEIERDGHDAVKLIPPGVTVAAQVNITPHLSHRRGLYVLHPTYATPDADYAIVSSHLTHYPYPSFQEIADYIKGLEEKGYVRVFDRNGWIVVKRPQSSPAL